MQQHVGVLILGPLGPVTLGIGVRRNVKGIAAHHGVDVTGDVLAEAWIDLVEHVAPIVEGPHLADGPRRRLA